MGRVGVLHDCTGRKGIFRAVSRRNRFVPREVVPDLWELSVSERSTPSKRVEETLLNGQHKKKIAKKETGELLPLELTDRQRQFDINLATLDH